MTGIERLRQMAEDFKSVKTAEHCTFIVNTWRGRYIDDAIADIADQIEREQEALVRETEDVAGRDGDALAWVEEHVGLERVKELLDWVVGHCSTKQQLDFDFWLSGRVMYELGFDEDRADRDEVERRLLARLMPEGMAWPRFEDGEPVRIGDVAVLADNEPHEVESMEFFADKSCKLKGKGTPWMNTIFKGQVAKRSAPKVLDADGVPIKVGDTVYPKYPYEEPDRQVESAEVVYVHRLGRIDIQAKYATGMSFRQQVDAEQLTHTKPKSSKRCRDCAHWQKDPTADKMGVCWFFYHEHEGQDCYPARLGDIGACEEFMPRASALAELERGE